MLLVLVVRGVLAVLVMLVMRATMLREVLCVGRAVARMDLGRVGEGHLAAVGQMAVRVAVGLVI